MPDLQKDSLVLFYGTLCEVVGFIDGEMPLVEISRAGEYAKRAEAEAKIKPLHEEQAAMTALEDPEERAEQALRHAEIDREIKSIVAELGPITRHGVRKDQFKYWPERDIWYVHGRLLSDAQMQTATARLGGRPKPEEQLAAYDLLEKEA